MKRLVQEIRERFSTSRGVLFHFKHEVVIITLEDLEFALERLKKEGKILYLGGFHDVEEFYRDNEEEK